MPEASQDCALIVAERGAPSGPSGITCTVGQDFRKISNLFVFTSLAIPFCFVDLVIRFLRLLPKSLLRLKLHSDSTLESPTPQSSRSRAYIEFWYNYFSFSMAQRTHFFQRHQVTKIMTKISGWAPCTGCTCPNHHLPSYNFAPVTRHSDNPEWTRLTRTNDLPLTSQENTLSAMISSGSAPSQLGEIQSSCFFTRFKEAIEEKDRYIGPGEDAYLGGDP